MKASIVDTNVAVTANKSHGDLGCILACVEKLIEIQENGVVAIDDQGLIMGEYRRNLKVSRRPPVRTGDAFMVWMHDHEWNPERCEQVPITPVSDDRAFAEIPDNPGLKGFHRKDRKFLAVAITSRFRATILNTTDTDWWNYRKALSQIGVHVENLCLDAVKRPRSRRT